MQPLREVPLHTAADLASSLLRETAMEPGTHSDLILLQQLLHDGKDEEDDDDNEEDHDDVDEELAR